jgi:hypothetical protein
MTLRTASLTSVLFAGCVVSAGHPPGDVTLLLTFDGLTECPAGIESVRLTIPGEPLADEGVMLCAAQIVLKDQQPGPYDLTVEALDSQGNVVSRGTAQYAVSGDVTVGVDLSLPTTPAFLKWTFPGGQTCAQAGITTVGISLDGDFGWEEVPCEKGESAEGFEELLTPGTHRLALSARDSVGFEFFGTRSHVAASSEPQTFPLEWTAGAVALRWTLAHNGVSTTCEAAGVSQVSISFEDALGMAGSPTVLDCGAGFGGVSFTMPAGRYTARVQATGPGGEPYASAAVDLDCNGGVFAEPGDGPLLVVDGP